MSFLKSEIIILLQQSETGVEGGSAIMQNVIFILSKVRTNPSVICKNTSL